MSLAASLVVSTPKKPASGGLLVQLWYEAGFNHTHLRWRIVDTARWYVAFNVSDTRYVLTITNQTLICRT